MACLDQETIAAFAMARLPSKDAGDVERHVRACAECHETVMAALARSGVAPAAAAERLGPSPAGHAAERAPLATGKSVGRYTLLGLVGRGGMGEVYAAYDPGLDRRIALKLLSADGAAQDDHAKERLLREAQSIAKLSHRNVVVVHDVGTFEGQVFVAMEFVDGATLSAWLSAEPRSWREIVAVFLQAARGLSAAHAAGLVHRDFKPQNVMVGKDGTARVMDFGIARRIGEAPEVPSEPRAATAPPNPSLTRTGELLGTPLYMAPEQFVSGDIDARADQFSFCVALYWALYGVHPFGGSSRAELAKNAGGETVAAPTKKSAAPAWIQKILLRGLSVDPGVRWPSMDELAAALSRDPARRRRTVALVGAVSVLCAVAALSAVHLSRRGRSFCLGGPERMMGVWEQGERAGPGSRREVVRAAILKSGVFEPSKTWDRVAALLDRHAAQWLGAYRDACEATHVRGEQSEEVLDLRMACLNDNLESTEALTKLLSVGAHAVVDHAVEAAGSLEDLARCGAVEQLRSSVRPPRDPLVRRSVEQIRKRLKEGNALRDAGQHERAVAVADEILARSDVGDYCPTQAEALLLKGLASAEIAPKDAVATTERAVVKAESCGHDRVVAAAMSTLIYLHQYDDWPAAESWATLDAAVLERMGGDSILEGWLANNVGILRGDQGRWEEARRETERAVALKERTLGPDNLDVAISVSNLAEMLAKLRRFDEAMATSERALVVMRRWVGPDSLMMINAVGVRADILLALKRFTEAEAEYRSVLEVLDTRVSKDNPTRLDTLMGLGSAVMPRGRLDEAIAMFAEVLRLREARQLVATEIAPVQFKLAVALDRAHRDGARARELATKAAAAYAAQAAFAPQLREVKAWLDQRQ